jgi:hypothetical protein
MQEGTTPPLRLQPMPGALRAAKCGMDMWSSATSFDEPNSEPRTEPRRARMRGVRAPTVEPRTAPHIGGARSAGPPSRPRRTGGRPLVGRGGPPPTASPVAAVATAPTPAPAPSGLSRCPTRTPSAGSGHVQTRIRCPAGHSGPLIDPPGGLRSDVSPRATNPGSPGPGREVDRGRHESCGFAAML